MKIVINLNLSTFIKKSEKKKRWQILEREIKWPSVLGVVG